MIDKDTTWVHEEDYGAFEPGNLLIGTFQLAWGLLSLVFIGIWSAVSWIISKGR